MTSQVRRRRVAVSCGLSYQLVPAFDMEFRGKLLKVQVFPPNFLFFLKMA